MGVCKMNISKSVLCKDDIKPPPNPNPYNFNIIQAEFIGNYVILIVQYPDCTTYEGKKCLVLRGVKLEHLKLRVALDPHFSDTDTWSPIARFHPTDEGLLMARAFIGAMQ